MVSKIKAGQSIPATCFPAAVALASSWDTTLVEEIGQALAAECLANDVQVLLGPGVNIKRTPLGGRCFEYYSEDPVLSGEMGSAFVQGVQSRGVGTSLKHYACNNQEYERMVISSEVDQRTLREIYLAAFERIVRKAHPWTVMAAYNKVNGVYASEHPELLRQILKTEWGYDGVVVSDWGAVNNKGDALAAGLDLQMPGRENRHASKIAQLVHDGELSTTAIDEAATRVLRLIFRGLEHRQPGAMFDPEAHHALARRAAAESAVLLKNEDNLLPLQTEQTSSIAIIGRFAKHPRYQGSGSARVNPIRCDNAYNELRLALGEHISLTYANGYTEEGSTNATLLQQAIELACSSNFAIVFVGLTDADESEGFDRQHLDMSEAHNRLIEAVASVRPETVVVLCNGSAITMPWIDKVKAILEMGLGGQASGGATADVLLGKVNPSGRLAETFAKRLEDTPAYLHYPGEAGQVRYGEGLFVGYRYYERKKIKPLFPFGYGLSYTTFEHLNLQFNKSSITDEETLEVTVTVRNAGTKAGQEVVQLYLQDSEASVVRPEKELKAFAKIALLPGETREVHLSLEPRDFAFYDSELQRWRVESGTFSVLIGKSSAEITLREEITVSARPIIPVFNKWQPLQCFFSYPQAAEALIGMFASLGTNMSEQESEMLNMQMIFGMPLAKLASFGTLTDEQIDAFIEQINQAVQG